MNGVIKDEETTNKWVILINQNCLFESFAYVTFTLKSKKTSSSSKDHMQRHMTKGYYLNEI